MRWVFGPALGAWGFFLVAVRMAIKLKCCNIPFIFAILHTFFTWNNYFIIMILRKINFDIIWYSVIFAATLYLTIFVWSSDFLIFAFINVAILVFLDWSSSASRGKGWKGGGWQIWRILQDRDKSRGFERFYYLEYFWKICGYLFLAVSRIFPGHRQKNPPLLNFDKNENINRQGSGEVNIFFYFRFRLG